MFQLHIWPGRWDLPTIDAQCLAAVLHLQLTVPGRFEIIECANPDLSPCGQLPFLKHEHHLVSPLSAIVAYVANLDDSLAPRPCDGLDSDDLLFTPSLDAELSPIQKAKSIAWSAYVESNLGDLVLNSFYAQPINYKAVTLPTLHSFLHFPQIYYVPSRLREMYRPRLEAAHLWDMIEDPDNPAPRPDWKASLSDSLHGKEEADDGPEKVRRAFAKEKVLQKARATFGYLASLTTHGGFIHGDSPTSLDVLLAAHILLILHAPLPNPLLKTVILESYPTLIDHALLLRTKAFPSQQLPPDSPLSNAPSWQGSFSSSDQFQFKRPHPPTHPLVDVTFKDGMGLSARGLARMARSLAGSLSPFRLGSRNVDNDVGDDDDEGASGEGAENELENRLSRGRWIWYAAAGVGLLAYTYLSGVIQVEFTGRGEEEPQEEEDDDDDD